MSAMLSALPARYDSIFSPVPPGSISFRKSKAALGRPLSLVGRQLGLLLDGFHQLFHFVARLFWTFGVTYRNLMF